MLKRKDCKICSICSALRVYCLLKYICTYKHPSNHQLKLQWIEITLKLRWGKYFVCLRHNHSIWENSRIKKTHLYILAEHSWFQGSEKWTGQFDNVISFVQDYYQLFTKLFVLSLITLVHFQCRNAGIFWPQGCSHRKQSIISTPHSIPPG